MPKGNEYVLELNHGPICVNDLDEPYRGMLKNYEALLAEIVTLKKLLEQKIQDQNEAFIGGQISERERIVKDLALKHRGSRTTLTVEFLLEVLEPKEA